MDLANSLSISLAGVNLAAPEVPRDGAVTPAEKRLSRPLFEAINVPHKPIRKICCIGAGYVGKLLPFIFKETHCCL